MRVLGLSRNRMRDALDRLNKERGKAVTRDQCVMLPFAVTESHMVIEPDEEERQSYEKEFKTIPGYTDEMFFPLLTINMASNIHAISSVFRNPIDLISKEATDDVLEEGINTSKFYLNKIKMFSQKDLDENPYIQRMKTDIDGIGLYKLTTEKYQKMHICMGSDFREYGYSYEHDIAIASEDIKIPVLMTGHKLSERVCMSDILLTQDAIDKAHGNVVAYDGTAHQYFAYMAHLKKDVESVTIVGDNGPLSELIEKCIIPRFDYPEKIRFIRNYKLTDCDFVYFRMWDEFRTNIDLYIDYLDFIKTRPDIFEKTQHAFYLENALLEHIKNVLLSDILLRAGIPVEFGVQVSDRAIDRILERFEDVNISTPGNLENVFRAGKIKEMITR